MQKHPYFNLLLHDDSELSTIIGSEIAERTTLHEWPVSCVQKIVTNAGRSLIYKTQWGHTVEAEFYANAQSSLLPTAQTIYEADGYACLLIEYIEGDMLENLGLSESEVAQVGKTLIAQINRIQGDLPYIYDVSTVSRWESLVNDLLQTIQILIESGTYTHTTSEHIRSLKQNALSPAVYRSIRQQTGYVHGDFTADNILSTANGYRVIDWAFPRLGPPNIDLALLVDSLGFDPLKHVESGIVVIMYGLKIKSFVDFTTRWFPDGAATYDEQIADLTARIEQIAL